VVGFDSAVEDVDLAVGGRPCGDRDAPAMKGTVTMVPAHYSVPGRVSDTNLLQLRRCEVACSLCSFPVVIKSAKMAMCRSQGC
jgi:hypothetical protein